MLGISGEHLLILGIVLIVFGPRRLPQLGHTMGKAIKNFKDGIAGIEEASYRKLDSQDNPQKKPPTDTDGGNGNPPTGSQLS